MPVIGSRSEYSELQITHLRRSPLIKKVSRFFYATGFSGHGFLQGPAIGEILRDLYLQKQPFVEIQQLSADRFSGGGQLRPEYNIV